MAGRQWQPGQSGNPGGRPKDNKIVREKAREHTEDALAVLYAVMMDEAQHGATRVSAAEALLNRGWGKPAQAIIGGDEDDPAVKFEKIERVIVDAAHSDS